MRKALKMKTLTALAVVALGTGALGFGLSANVNAKADGETPETPAFYVLNGGAVRLNETPAVKFTLRMSKGLYTMGSQAESVEVGAVLLPEDLVGNDFDEETEGAVVAKIAETKEGVTVSEWVESAEDTDYMESYVMLENIPKESFNRPISVKGYAIVEGQTMYTDVVSRSMAGIAYELVEQELLAEEAVAQYFTQTYAVDFFDEDGATELVDTQNLKYGATLEVATAEKDGKVLKGWQKRIGTEDGEAVWSTDLYDFNASNAKFVQGNLQFRAVWANAPQAFGGYMTAEMLVQNQEDAGEHYTHNTVYDVVEKEGVNVAVLKTARAGLWLEATEEFLALIPTTAKDSDYIVFDLYAYSASGWLLAGVTQSGNLVANAWTTAKTTVGAFKANPKVYSNGLIAVANFRIEEVKFINAFGTEISEASKYLPSTTFDMLEKDGETVGVFNATAWSGGSIITATADFLALFADAKDDDLIVFDVYFKTSWRFYSCGDKPTTAYPAGSWQTFKILVSKFRANPIFQTLAEVYLANFRIQETVPLTAFGTQVTVTTQYFPSTSSATLEKDGKNLQVFNATSWSGGSVITATDAFLALFADAADTDYFLMDVYFETSWYFYMYGQQQKDKVYQENTWYTIEVSVSSFRANPKFQTLAKVYITNIRMK